MFKLVIYHFENSAGITTLHVPHLTVLSCHFALQLLFELVSVILEIFAEFIGVCQHICFHMQQLYGFVALVSDIVWTNIVHIGIFWTLHEG